MVQSITIRGENRNTTIIDGEFQRANGFLVAGVDGVAIEESYYLKCFIKRFLLGNS